MTETLVIPLLAGLASGLVANYVADVLPLTRRLGHPSCARCGTPYPWGAYLGGKACSNCGLRRGPRPWLVVALMIALSIYTWFEPHRMGYVLGLLLLTYFAVVVVVDLEHRLILHPTSLVGALLAIGIGTLVRGAAATVLGGVVGALVMLILYGIGILFSRIRNRRLAAAGREADNEDALGWGDVILGGILGLLLGWPLIGLGLFVGILIGGVIGLIFLITMLVRGGYRQQALMVFMPYGPAFILSAFLILYLPELISSFLPK